MVKPDSNAWRATESAYFALKMMRRISGLLSPVVTAFLPSEFGVDSLTAAFGWYLDYIAKLHRPPARKNALAIH